MCLFSLGTSFRRDRSVSIGSAAGADMPMLPPISRGWQPGKTGRFQKPEASGTFTSYGTPERRGQAAWETARLYGGLAQREAQHGGM